MDLKKYKWSKGVVELKLPFKDSDHEMKIAQPTLIGVRLLFSP